MSAMGILLGGARLVVNGRIIEVIMVNSIVRVAKISPGPPSRGCYSGVSRGE